MESTVGKDVLWLKASISLDDFIPRFSGRVHTTTHAKMRWLGIGMGFVEGSNAFDP